MRVRQGARAASRDDDPLAVAHLVISLRLCTSGSTKRWMSCERMSVYSALAVSLTQVRIPGRETGG